MKLRSTRSQLSAAVMTGISVATGAGACRSAPAGLGAQGGAWRLGGRSCYRPITHGLPPNGDALLQGADPYNHVQYEFREPLGVEAELVRPAQGSERCYVPCAMSSEFCGLPGLDDRSRVDAWTAGPTSPPPVEQRAGSGSGTRSGTLWRKRGKGGRASREAGQVPSHQRGRARQPRGSISLEARRARPWHRAMLRAPDRQSVWWIGAEIRFREATGINTRPPSLPTPIRPLALTSMTICTRHALVMKALRHIESGRPLIRRPMAVAQ